MKRMLSMICLCFGLAAFAAPVQAKVAVVAHEPGYYTSLANHIQRWLKGAEVPSVVVTPKDMSAALSSAKIAFFVGFVEPTDGEVKQIGEFIKHGGKAVVFYTASPALASLMGVKVLGYKAAPCPGAWSRMDFDASALPGCPRSILQTSTVLQRAVPVKGRGYAMANWLDRSGKASGEAAWIKTDAGFWMTHVLLADGDEALKAQLLAAMCGSADKTLWNAEVFAAKAKGSILPEAVRQ